MAGKLDSPITGFPGELIPTEKTIVLSMIVGSTSRWSQVQLTFTVVKIPLVYNAIFGRLGLSAFRIMVSTYYLLTRFPTLHGVKEVHRNQALVRQCYLVNRNVKPSNTFPVKGLDTRDELAEKKEIVEDVVVIFLHDGNP